MKVNGEILNLEKMQDLETFLLAQNYELSRIAVEKNGLIIAKENYKDEMLQNEDILLIVRFVGGG